MSNIGDAKTNSSVQQTAPADELRSAMPKLVSNLGLTAIEGELLLHIVRYIDGNGIVGVDLPAMRKGMRGRIGEVRDAFKRLLQLGVLREHHTDASSASVYYLVQNPATAKSIVTTDEDKAHTEKATQE